MIQAVLFDMDGTVVETTMTHDFPVWTELLKDYDVSLSLSVFQNFLGKKASEIFRQFVPSITEEQIETSLQKRDLLLSQSINQKGIDTTPGLIGFLDRLQKNGCKVALATGAERKKVDIICNHVPLQQYFPVIVTADDVKRGKPYPDLFLKAADELDVNPENCIVVEDANNGIEAAHRANMKCIAITTTHKKDELKGADLVINSFNELKGKTLQNI